MEELDFSDDATRERLGVSLKFMAQRQGMTQRALADALGITAPTVSKLWSGSIKKPQHYESMARHLGVTMESLLAPQVAAAPRTTPAAAAPSEEAQEPVARVIPLEVPQSRRGCQVITVAARKGGSTKTTTTVHVCGALARAGHRVLLIDLDGQRDATEWLLDPELTPTLTADDVLRHGMALEEGILPSLVQGLDVLPASSQMDTIEAAMAGQWGMERRLDSLLANVRKHYDFILFDCPAAMDFRIVSALMSSDWALIPTTASTLDIKGLIAFIPKVLHFADPVRFNPRLQFLGILISRVKRNTLLARDARAWLGEEFEELLFDHVVHESTRYQELAGYQSLIYDHDPEWSADYEGVAQEILSRVGWLDEDAAPSQQGGRS